DVVADLAARMGVPPPPVADRYNQGLSLEATALLYAIRRTGRGLHDQSRPAAYLAQATAAALAPVPGDRFALAGELDAQVLDTAADDIAWATARLGAPLADDHAPGPIRGDADMLAIAAAARPLLAVAVTATRPGVTVTPADLALWVEQGLASG